jgi:hypothetical protein
MPRKYHTLLVATPGQLWGPQFGDYEKEVVTQELDDTRHEWPKGTKFKVVTLADAKQSTLTAALELLNNERSKQCLTTT